MDSASTGGRTAAPPGGTAGSGLSAEAATLAGRAVRGTFWVMLTFGLLKSLGLVTNLILARLLAPADFGLVAFAMIAIRALALLRDLGVPEALIYDRQDVRQVGGTALTINVVMAFGLAAVVVIAAPYLAGLGGNDAITNIVIVLAVGLVAEAAGSVQRAWFAREFEFRRALIPGTLPVALSGISSIVLALNGFGAWSLVYGYLARTVSSTFVLWLCSDVRPWPRFDSAVARRLLGYGSHVSYNSVLGFVNSNLDYFIIGAVLGSSALGSYTLAFTLAVLPSAMISENVATSTFPAYTRIRNDMDSLRRMFLDTSKLVTFVVVLLAIGMYLCSPSWVPFLLGEQWRPAIAVLLILIPFAITRALSYTFNPLYKAVGRPDLVWKLRLIRLVLTVPVLGLAVRAGVEGVAIGQGLLQVIFLSLNAVRLTGTIDLPVRRYLQELRGPVLATAASLAVLVPLQMTSLGSDLNRTPAGALFLSAIVATIYVIVAAATDQRLLVLVRTAISGLLAGRRGSQTRPHR
jgi:O-antigen/teichoic acid export membrane protein